MDVNRTAKFSGAPGTYGWPPPPQPHAAVYNRPSIMITHHPRITGECRKCDGSVMYSRIIILLLLFCSINVLLRVTKLGQSHVKCSSAGITHGESSKYATQKRASHLRRFPPPSTHPRGNASPPYSTGPLRPIPGTGFEFLVPVRLPDWCGLPRRCGRTAAHGLFGAGAHGVQRQKAGSALPAIESISPRSGRLNTLRSIAIEIRNTSTVAVSTVF